MKTPHASPNGHVHCWSCQEPLVSGSQVYVGDSSIPCCRGCWSQMTVEQRLRVGQMFSDRQDGGAIDAAATLLRSAFGRFIEESGGHEWMRGRGN